MATPTGKPIPEPIKKNAINIMKFEHDDWCNKMKSVKKECNCNPDVSVGPLE